MGSVVDTKLGTKEHKLWVELVGVGGVGGGGVFGPGRHYVSDMTSHPIRERGFAQCPS